MQQALDNITIESRGQGLYDFTRQVRAFVASVGITTGLLTVYVRHTSCSLLVQEMLIQMCRQILAGFSAG